MVCPPAVAASLDSVDLIPWEASSVEVMRRSPDGDNCCVVVVDSSSFVEGLAQVSSLFSVLHPSSVVMVVVSSGASLAETVNIIGGCSSTAESSIDAAMMSHRIVVRGAAFRLIVILCLRWIFMVKMVVMVDLASLRFGLFCVICGHGPVTRVTRITSVKFGADNYEYNPISIYLRYAYRYLVTG